MHYSTQKNEFHTELTAIERKSPDGVSMPDILTRQAPQPPSKHMNFVPVNLAWLRMNTNKLVSIGTSSGLTNFKKNIKKM